MNMSKSRLNCYLNCPRRYYYDYIDKSIKKDPVEPGSPLEIGLEVHEIFEWFHKNPKAKEIKPPYNESIFNILMEHDNAHKHIDMMQNFVNFNLELIKECGVPKYVPKFVELDLTDANLGLRGIIDVVIETKDGITLLDYKTGKRARPISEYMLELTLYKILYENVCGEKVDYVGIYFPAVDKYRMARVLDLDREPIGKGPFITFDDEIFAIATLENIREKIEEGHTDIKNFKPQPNFLCNYCDYADVCKQEGVLNI